GKISGKERIRLETYIQRTYLDRILNHANVHLMKMSGGHFELRRSKSVENMRSQSGLELNIIDHFNGTERSVKTLSGGESFIASLSLALGLSDEIQMSAGGIKLDTMFVDEGFGSLDESSLNQAINVLNGISQDNLLIGIISHVAELKERIDKKIVVTKEKYGESSVRIEV
ncbi:MAG: SMC family ATPase, partial [Firmicutes bacterium]|nr:SMC family ATPase [Bacillota bacterium]